jgi:hypothetical protein
MISAKDEEKRRESREARGARNRGKRGTYQIQDIGVSKAHVADLCALLLQYL